MVVGNWFGDGGSVMVVGVGVEVVMVMTSWWRCHKRRRSSLR